MNLSEKEKFLLSPETPEGQRKAIMTDDKIITVGAGAGTGKTWVLSNRYARLLVDYDDLLPRDILTLTYTEAAAAEMKQRIEGRLRDSTKGFKDKERLRELTDGFADSWISTIHSFAARLLRESGLSLDIDPRASVISAQQEQDFWDSLKSAVEFAEMKRLAKAYCEKSIQDLAGSLDKDINLGRAVNKWKAEALSNLARFSAEIHASSGYSWENMLEWSENDELINKAWPQVKNIIRSELQEVWKIWSRVIIPASDSKKALTAKQMNLVGILNWLHSHDINDDNALKYFYLYIMDGDGLSNGRGAAFTALKNSLGGTLSEWKKTRREIFINLAKVFDSNANFSDSEREMRSILLKFCAVSWAIWDTMKRKRGLLSFSDMILHAKRTIVEGGVKRKFSHILVDEFQDTDPLQFKMIESLVGEQTSLFAVGDPKQSIYKFRNAEPALFARTIQRAQDSGTRVELDASFRTRASLLSYINGLFASIWKDGLGSSDSMAGLKYESLKPSAIADEMRDSGTMPDTKIFLARRGKDTKQARKILAENLARNIAQWVKEGRTVWDKSQRLIRPVKFSDFAILSRSRGIYETLEEALSKFNIPSVQDKSTDYFSRGEVNDVICTLRAAAGFNDSFSVMGWLMSPFSGVKLSEAINCLESLNKSLSAIEAIKQSLPEAYSRLEYLALIGEHEGPAALLEYFDRDRRWLESYKESDRLRVLRNLRLAINISENFQQSGTAGLIACADWLGRAVRRKANSIEEASWHDKDENAVLLSVVHSAKGLEYPVTVIFESRTKKNNTRGNIRPSKELGIVFKDIPDELDSESEPIIQGSDWDALLSEQGDSEEETRLFYVAATRAQDSLIYCGLVKEKDDSPDNNTWTKILLEHDKNACPEYVVEINDFDSFIMQDDSSHKDLQPVNLVKTRNLLRQVSASSFALFEFCPFAWRRRYRQGINLTWENPDREVFLNDDNDFTGGAGTGSLAHWILARWPRTGDYESELVNLLTDRKTLALLPGSLRSVWRDKKAKEALHEWLMNFANSDKGRKIIQAQGIKHEERFRVRLEAQTSMAGAFDALCDNTVIDYKITAIKNTPAGLYDSQLDFYALAIHELTGAESVNTVIAFLRECEFIEKTISGSGFDDIKKRVLSFAESGAGTEYGANTHNCKICPFKKGCAKREHEG